jgi:hypothetical protein
MYNYLQSTSKIYNDHRGVWKIFLFARGKNDVFRWKKSLVFYTHVVAGEGVEEPGALYRTLK